MYTHDLIIIGTGSTYPIIETFLNKNPGSKVALIDKDDPGGISLTRGCVPSKILLHYAQMVQFIKESSNEGLVSGNLRVNPEMIMHTMREKIHESSQAFRNHLLRQRDVFYQQCHAAFIAPYTLVAGSEVLSAPCIILATGSAPYIPNLPGLENAGYLTTDTLLMLSRFPESLIIIGAGCTAAEYGFFFSSVGIKVTIIGRNPSFLPGEEPEISDLAQKILAREMSIITGVEAQETGLTEDNQKYIRYRECTTGKEYTIQADEILLATGRAPQNILLEPEKGGIDTSGPGWLSVNRYLESSQKNIWAMGDGTGNHFLKTIADYEADIISKNAIMGEAVPVDYRIIPHAVFISPEIASVGLSEKEAVQQYGEENIRIGWWKYTNTARGVVIGISDGFVKIIIEVTSERILGAHIIGPEASLIIQELVTVMHAGPGGIRLILASMYIHPTYSEVVREACIHTYTIPYYHKLITEL